MYHLSNCFFRNVLLFSQITLVLVSCTCPGFPTCLPLLILLTLPLAVELLLYPQHPLRCHLSIKLLLSPLKVMLLLSLLNKAFSSIDLIRKVVHHSSPFWAWKLLEQEPSLLPGTCAWFSGLRMRGNARDVPENGTEVMGGMGGSGNRSQAAPCLNRALPPSQSACDELAPIMPAQPPTHGHPVHTHSLPKLPPTPRRNQLRALGEVLGEVRLRAIY